VRTGRPLRLQLTPSRLLFRGDPSRPQLQLHAATAIEDTTVTVNVTGTPAQPELQVASMPPAPPDQVLLMLATGRNWTDTEQALRDGEISLAAAQELAGYFTGTTGDSIGASRVQVSYKENAERRDIGVSTAVTEDVSIGYTREESMDRGSQGDVTQTLSAERALSDDAAAEIETKQDTLTAQSSPEVYLKYKRRF
jgi:autotransporter translocation and assembly factor TamB